MILLGHQQATASRSAGFGPEHDFGQTLYWPMQETSGTTMTEVMAGLNGSYVGGPVVNSAGPRSGYVSVAFDGSNDYATVAHGAALNPGTSDYAVEYWLKMGNDGSLGVIWGKFASGTSPTFPGVLIFSNFVSNATVSAGGVTHRTQNSTNYYQSFTAPSASTTWYHWLFQRRLDAGTYYLRAYLNGVLQTSWGLPGSTNITTTDPLYVMGRPSSTQTTLGSMACLRWYNNKSFTDAEAATIYAARIS